MRKKIGKSWLTGFGLLMFGCLVLPTRASADNFEWTFNVPVELEKMLPEATHFRLSFSVEDENDIYILGGSSENVPITGGKYSGVVTAVFTDSDFNPAQAPVNAYLDAKKCKVRLHIKSNSESAIPSPDNPHAWAKAASGSTLVNQVTMVMAYSDSLDLTFPAMQMTGMKPPAILELLGKPKIAKKLSFGPSWTFNIPVELKDMLPEAGSFSVTVFVHNDSNETVGGVESDFHPITNGIFSGIVQATIVEESFAHFDLGPEEATKAVINLRIAPEPVSYVVVPDIDVNEPWARPAGGTPYVSKLNIPVEYDGSDFDLSTTLHMTGLGGQVFQTVNITTEQLTMTGIKHASAIQHVAKKLINVPLDLDMDDEEEQEQDSESKEMKLSDKLGKQKMTKNLWEKMDGDEEEINLSDKMGRQKMTAKRSGKGLQDKFKKKIAGKDSEDLWEKMDEDGRADPLDQYKKKLADEAPGTSPVLAKKEPQLAQKMDKKKNILSKYKKKTTKKEVVSSSDDTQLVSRAIKEVQIETEQ